MRQFQIAMQLNQPSSRALHLMDTTDASFLWFDCQPHHIQFYIYTY